MAIDPKQLENGTILIVKDGEWTPYKLSKLFYDVSSALNVNRLEWLFGTWQGIYIKKDNNSLSFNIDMNILDKHYSIVRDDKWNLYQWWKMIPLPKIDIVQPKQPEIIWKKKEDEDLEKRVAELEKIVIKLQNKILDSKIN